MHVYITSFKVSLVFQGPVGEPGPPGDKGEKGRKGNVGENGGRGPKGLAGKPVSILHLTMWCAFTGLYTGI